MKVWVGLAFALVIVAVAIGVRVTWAASVEPTDPFVGVWEVEAESTVAPQLRVAIDADARGELRVTYGHRGARALVVRATKSRRSGREQLNWVLADRDYYRVVITSDDKLRAERFSPASTARQVFELRRRAAHLPALVVGLLHLAGFVSLYFTAGGLVFLFATRLLGRWRPGLRVTVGTRSQASQYRLEVWRSLRTLLVFVCMGIAIVVGQRHGVFLVYSDRESLGLLYLGMSVVILIIAHDAYFYWTHRAMHLPVCAWLNHRVHHESRTTSPWTSYSFSVPEALIQALFVPMVLLVLPVHAGAVLAFVVLAFVRAVVAHAGVEIVPAPLSRFLMSSTNVAHHAAHHADGRVNFGLYFSWWDVAMKTGGSDRARARSSASSALPPGYVAR